MSSKPFVSIKTDEFGSTYVLLRQLSIDGDYSVEICLSMDHFSCLMALLQGLEMYFMDIELKKSVNLLPTISVPSSSGEEQYNPENSAFDAKKLSELPERPSELNLNVKKKKTTRKRKFEENDYEVENECNF